MSEADLYVNPATHPNEAEWPEIPGMVQIRVAVFDKDRGWIVSRRGIIYGFRHGPPPQIDGDLNELNQIVTIETLAGVRAIRHRLVEESNAKRV